MQINKGETLLEAFSYAEKSLQAKLESANFPAHPVAKGDVAEDIWRNTLRRYLPSRYSIESGFVIDSKNNTSQQIDCIIYDNVFTPTFWGEHGYVYIPAEAVYAVFEIKQKADKQNIEYASEKISSVRGLFRTSAFYTGDGEKRPPKPLFRIVGGLIAREFSIKHKRIMDVLYEIRNAPDENANIDVILTAKDGYIDFFNEDYHKAGSSGVDSCQTEGAAIKGIFRLIRVLVEQGTVGAIDWRRYYNSLSEDEST